MPELTDQSELDAYYLADSSHHRTAGVMWPALVERRIDKLFSIGFRPDKAVKDELFKPSGALGNYAVKVRVAYMLGWIEKDFYNDLILVSKIRNRFAHEIEATNFEDTKILSWLNSMQAHKNIRAMLKNADRIIADEDSDPVAKVPRVLSARGRKQIISGMIEDPQMGFRFCIDQIIHHLDKCARQMSENLSKVPGNWLVSDSSLK